MDPWNATAAEIEAWSCQHDADWPTQDWDLAITDQSNIQLIFRLAADDHCPNRWFFLRCLYLYVGDAVRSDFRAHSRDGVDGLLAAVSAQSPKRIQRWAERARNLIQTGKNFVYSDWCDGRLASIDELEIG